MNTEIGLDRCRSFINYQLQPADPARHFTEQERKSAVTISRQSGCGAHAVAEKLAAYLKERGPKGSPEWMVFDHNLVGRVLEEHHLPERLARFMPEDRVSEMDDIMDDLFGVRPQSWALVEQASETILHLAELGNVIILGRGANIVTARLPHVLHVRLIASLEKRIEHMQKFEGLDRKAAAQRIQREDLGRARYVKKYFHKEIDDPLLYHLVINTDLVSFDDAARVIGGTVLAR